MWELLLLANAKGRARLENPVGGSEKPTKCHTAFSFWLADPLSRILEMDRNGARLESLKRRLEELYKGRLQLGSPLKGGEQAAGFGVAPLRGDGDSHSTGTRNEIRPLQRLARLCFSLVENLGCQDASKAREGELAGAPWSHKTLSDLVAVALLANGSHSSFLLVPNKPKIVR